jgi:formamidopyrimidine-DNA glycosylase
MPELPEVETVRLGLQKLIVGKTIKSVFNDWPKSFPNALAQVNEFMISAKVTQVRRRAKVLMIDLSTNYSLVVHLKMTGQLVYRGEQNWGAGHPNDSLIAKLPDKSTRVDITFADDSNLFFNDQRKFGWMRLLPTPEVPNIDFMKKVGPEPLEPSFTKELFLKQIQKRKNSNIKAALLDQTVLAGIGNIYADESLFLAKINPASIVGRVPKARLINLHQAIIGVLKISLEKGGSTDRNYINAEGKKGSYIEFAKVFRKDNQPCPVCGSIIIKTRVAGRGTHVCNKCQKLYK